MYLKALERTSLLLIVVGVAAGFAQFGIAGIV